MFANKECCKKKKKKKRIPMFNRRLDKHNVYSLVTVFKVNTKCEREAGDKLKHLGKDLQVGGMESVRY